MKKKRIITIMEKKKQPYILLAILTIFVSWCNKVHANKNWITFNSQNDTELHWTILHHIWRADFQNLLHPLLHVTHLQIRSQQRSQFSTQKLLQMENVDTNWNLEKKISKNSNSTIVRTAFWPCHKIWTYIKKNKGIKSCLVPKPLLSTPACHSFPLSITL